MKNEEYLNRWNERLDIHNINLDNISFVLFVEDGETIDDFLDFCHIDKNKLIQTKNKKVNRSLEKMDDLMLEVTEHLRVFIVDNLFDDVSEDTLINEYHQTKTEMENIYSQFQNEIVSIRSELKEKSDVKVQGLLFTH